MFLRDFHLNYIEFCSQFLAVSVDFFVNFSLRLQRGLTSLEIFQSFRENLVFFAQRGFKIFDFLVIFRPTAVNFALFFCDFSLQALELRADFFDFCV